MTGIIAKDTSTGGSTETKSKFPLLEAGTFQGIAIWMYDIGTHMTQWQDEEPKPKQKVIIVWEIPSERCEIDGEDLPRVLSHTYNLSLHENATLCKHLEGFRGATFSDKEKQGFDLTTILGHNCLLNVVHEVSKSNGKTYAKIQTISPLMKGMPKLEPETPIRWYSTGMGDEICEGTPQWIVDKIEESVEWKHFHKKERSQEMTDKVTEVKEVFEGAEEDDSLIPF